MDSRDIARALCREYRSVGVCQSGERMFQARPDVFDAISVYSGHNPQFDLDGYLKYFAANYTPVDLELLADRGAIFRFVQKTTIRDKYRKILRWFDRSVDKVADDCVSTGFRSSRDFVKDVVQRNLVGEYVISGRMSLYYLAGIRDFDKVLQRHASGVSLDTLGYFIDNFDSYQYDIRTAFKEERGGLVCRPFFFTDQRIAEKLELV